MPSERKALADEAVRRVLRDWHSQGGAPVGVSVDDYGAFVDINVGGGLQHPSVWAEGDSATFMREVIDVVHAELVSLVGQTGAPLLPVCPTHRAPVHARVHGTTVAWWCGTGAHHPACVGEL